MGCPAGTPSDNPPDEDIDDEGDTGEAAPGRDIGEVRDPERIGTRCLELPVDAIQRPRESLVVIGCLHAPSTNNSLQFHGFHQPSNSAARHILALAPQLPPDLAHPVDLEVLRKDAMNFVFQDDIQARPRQPLSAIGALGGMIVTSLLPANAFICRKGGKYELALRRIPLAWRSSRTSRSRALTLATMSVVTPGLRPA